MIECLTPALISNPHPKKTSPSPSPQKTETGEGAKKKKKMGCVACGRPVNDARFHGAHWLCRAHRRALGAHVTKRVEPTEATLLRALVFDFPARCGETEFVQRYMHVHDVWKAHDKGACIARTYALRTPIARGGVTRAQLLPLLDALVRFLCDHSASLGAPAVALACAARVRESWYALVVDAAGRAEGILHAVERATGTRDFLLRSDLARAFAARLPHSVVRRVYGHYVAALAVPPSRMPLA